jgi:predicted glycosyltransferase
MSAARSISAPPVCTSGGRFLFYTNECVGLGHLRRTMALARAVTERDAAASALVITGSEGASGYQSCPRVDTVKLPVLSRDDRGVYHSRRLGVGSRELQGLRSTIARAAAESFDPRVVVVDKTPLGLADELVPTLESLLQGGSTRRILGLRDIEDEPAVVRERWRRARMREAICRYYDAVLVYGTESTLDALDCMGWHDLPVPVHHVGYVGLPLPEHGPDDLPEGYLLVTVGGGADGYRTLAAALEALSDGPLPCPVVLVTGPLMPAAEVAELRERAPAGVTIESFRADMDAVIVGARAVVTMAGYNTVSELFRARKPALLLPRAVPSREQLIRAQTVSAEGLAEMLHPDELTPRTLRAAIERLLEREPPRVDLEAYGGAASAARILQEIAASPERPAPVPTRRRVATAEPARAAANARWARRAQSVLAALDRRPGTALA